MTENDTEATEPEQSQPTSAPVRVPNVSPGAKSGIDHQVIGGAAQDAYDATEGADDGEDATGTDDGTAGGWRRGAHHRGRGWLGGPAGRRQHRGSRRG